MVGFTGSRRPSPALAVIASGVAASCSSAGLSVAVGCAAGIDAAVRAAVPGARVFEASGASPWGYVARSVALVEAVHASGRGALAVFPSRQCPAGLVPSRQSARCFCGSGSGTWATAAYAAGLEVPVCVFGAFELPVWGGVWERVGWACAFSGGWVWRPGQLGLF
jgi:hypothetical protein